MFTIEVISYYKELYRYNIISTCAGYNSNGEQLYVVSAEMIYREQINTDIVSTPIIPLNFKVGQSLTLTSEDAASIYAIIYIITNTLPEDRIVDNTPPFPIQITIKRGSEVIYDQEHEVNQWGGATINIKL